MPSASEYTFIYFLMVQSELTWQNYFTPDLILSG